MLTKIFAVLVLLSALSALLTGNVAALSEAVLSGAGRAVSLSISLCGMMCLWCGLLEVFRASGAVARLTRLLRPLLAFAFPGAVESGEGLDEIASNVAANLLGMGNAATPFGLAAMERLARAAPDRHTATPDMITLAVLNCSSLSCLPATLVTLRYAAGSARPAAILPAVWLVSLCCSAAAVLLCRLFGSLPEKRRKQRRKREPPPDRGGAVWT
ncbi:MAG: spore maturation protein A [Eubacteriales bacterium]